jgi:hypothetical protein
MQTMEKEKRKNEDHEDAGDSSWGFMVQWLLVLLLMAALIFVILWIMGPSVGNVFSSVISGDTF